MTEKKTTREPLSRRDLIRITAAAAPCAMLYACRTDRGTQTTNQGTKQASHSVFEDDCRDGNKDKYQNGDLPVLGGLLAMWIMLTTDEWSTCLSDPAWRARLANELKLDPNHLESVYAIATDDTAYTDPVNNFTYSNQEAFIWVRKKWSDFISSHNLYGKRPCPGGQTLLKIANQL